MLAFFPLVESTPETGDRRRSRQRDHGWPSS